MNSIVASQAELTTVEVAAEETQQQSEATTQAIVELRGLDLALIGGGMGSVNLY
jgi:hypothetical protein